MFKFFNLKNWKTTILGALSTILFALVSFGIISGDEASAIGVLVNDIVNNLGAFWPTVGWVLYGISSIILLFAADPPSGGKGDKDANQSGSAPTPGSSLRKPALGFR